MLTTEILKSIDEEIARLEEVKALLTGAPHAVRGTMPKTTAKSKPAKLAPMPRKGRTISPEGKARIAAAQKARWARAKQKM